LSHSVSQDYDIGSLACFGENEGTDHKNEDNVYYKAYSPSEFGFNGDFQAMGVGFVAEFSDTGGTNPTVVNSVKLFTSDDVFPAGTLTEIASQEFEVTAADDGVLFEVMFDEKIVLDASTEIIVAIDIAAADAPPGNYDFDIGRNDLGQNAPSYLSSEACSLTEIGTFADINFPDEHLILNLIGDSFLNSNEFLAENISIFPNPANDIVNLEIPSNIELTSAKLYDLTGKDTGLIINSDTINVSNLSSDVYLLRVETTKGSISKKLVIQ